MPIIRITLIWIALCFSGAVFAQGKKEDLQKQKDEINEKIALTKKLIADAEKNQKNTTSLLAVLNEQISYREQLINNISSEIKSIDSDIEKNNKSIGQLEADVKAMKAEYANMIYQAYKNRSAYAKLMFILAARDFNQAYKRFKITQQYATIRKDQVASIIKTQNLIEGEIEVLKGNKDQKSALALEKEKERDKIAKDKSEQQSKLNSFKSEEKKLRDQQKKQEAERKALTAKIEQIIKDEIRAQQLAEEKRRKEEEAKNAASKAVSGKSNTAAKTEENTKSSTATKSLELAPEVKTMNADFEKNKGNLSWPVNSGIITSRFGKHPHPSIPGIEVPNNGVDFLTENNGQAQAIFAGTVTSIFNIPGAGMNIIVTHGTYKSVYSGLETVNVKVGDKVTAKQKLGSVANNGEEYVLHFEIWKVSGAEGVAQNPELWFKK